MSTSLGTRFGSATTKIELWWLVNVEHPLRILEISSDQLVPTINAGFDSPEVALLDLK